MPFACTSSIQHPVKTLALQPWSLFTEPFQVSPRTWYVSGQSWVGCWLIETSEGCILIDTAIPESSYLLIYSIMKTGHQMKDIKKILLSHAHFDHCGCAMEMKQLSGAEVYMSKEDWDFYKAVPEETLYLDPSSHPQDFTVDHFYDGAVTLGDITVETVLTPGHTAGTTSFFWKEVNPVNGKTCTLAMHGGVGALTMKDSYYQKSRYLKPWMREKFLLDCKMLKSRHVDIALPSHPNQITILDRAGMYTNENMIFCDETVWADFLDERIRQVKDCMHL